MRDGLEAGRGGGNLDVLGGALLQKKWGNSWLQVTNVLILHTWERIDKINTE